MKSLFENNRKRIAAWVCAVVVVFGSAGTLFCACSKKQPDTSEPVKDFSTNSTKSDNGVISAGGTVESQQLCDYLGFESTNLRLKIDEVYVESGETIEEGTAIYKLTADSLEKAEKTLNTELQSAESSLLNQKMQYTESKNTAYALYQSELLSGDNATASLNECLSSLDSDLEKALNSYTEAKNIVNNYPASISAKESEMNAKQSEANECQQRINDLQNETSQKKESYNSALANYNEAVSLYNASAGTVQFIGSKIGMDVSDVKLRGTEQGIEQEQNNQQPAQPDNMPSGNNPPDGGSMPDFNSGDFSGRGDMAGFDGGSFNKTSFSVNSTADLLVLSNEETPKSENNAIANELYNSARSDYEEKKNLLTQAEEEYRRAENEYKECQSKASDYNNQLKECQNAVSSLTKEISSLNSELSQAKKNISSLESKYNSLKSTYDGDKIDLQQTYDSDVASGNNAEYNYQITLATIEADLETAQDTYDKAENNLKIFRELLSDGVIKAQQSGIVYSVTYEEGNSMNVNSPLIYYVNEETYTTTVVVDQYDVIKINVGDEVTIYSSETGTETGTVTSITAGETTSLADVNFNVTITADENSKLYTGESVNVYFNLSGMSGFSFEDAQSGKNSEDRERGERPGFDGNFSGFGDGMPGGFDPSNMPQGGGRPDSGNRKEK